MREGGHARRTRTSSWLPPLKTRHASDEVEAGAASPASPSCGPYCSSSPGSFSSIGQMALARARVRVGVGGQTGCLGGRRGFDIDICVCAMTNASIHPSIDPPTHPPIHRPPHPEKRRPPPPPPAAPSPPPPGIPSSGPAVPSVLMHRREASTSEYGRPHQSV